MKCFSQESILSITCLMLFLLLAFSMNGQIIPCFAHLEARFGQTYDRTTITNIILGLANVFF
jgi:hypothetical protein